MDTLYINDIVKVNFNTILYVDDIDFHISGKSHENLQSWLTMSSKKLITGFVLTNYVPIIPKVIHVL